MNQLQNLYKLQQLDDAIGTGKVELAGILQAQKEPDDLVALRQQTAALTSQVKQLKTQLKDEELELGTVGSKLSHNQQEMYSGKVKNAKTLQDLELESQALGRRQDDLENHMLETMTDLEELEKQLATASAALSKAEAVWSSKVADLKASQHELALSLNDLLAKRSAQTAKIDPKLLREYSHLLKTRKGTAVAEVIYDICQGCRVTVNQAVLRQIELNDIAHCPSCQRILIRPHR